MKQLKMYFYAAIIVMTAALSSCSTKNAQTDEEVKAMDSVSTDLEASNKELDTKTSNVEASLEKIDKEYNASK